MVPDTAQPGAPESSKADVGVVQKRKVNLDGLGLRLIRPSAVHRNYIISTWVLSASDAVAKRGVRRSVCRAEEDGLCKAAIESGSVFVLVDEVDDSVIHGWIAGVKGLLQWAYLPPQLRGKGIFRSMAHVVCGKDLEYTRRPRSYKPPGYWTYNPYRIGE